MTTRAVLSYIIHDNTGTNSEMIYYYRNIICFLLQSVPNNSIKPRHVWEWKQLLGLLRFSMWKISFNNLQQSTVLCNICKKTVSTKRGTHTHTFLLEKKQKNIKYNNRMKEDLLAAVMLQPNINKCLHRAVLEHSLVALHMTGWILLRPLSSWLKT